MTDIAFYRASGPYACFSNLFRREFIWRGIQFDCRERAYQAGPDGKARRREVQDWLMAAPSPSLCAMAAHGLNYWDIRPGWSRDRFARMLDINQAFFQQHADCVGVLISTGGARLVECGAVDSDVNRRWGEVNGRGQNWQGKILMQVRHEMGGQPAP